MPSQHPHLLASAAELRARLEPHFSEETAASGYSRTSPSAGHCAAVAAIVASGAQPGLEEATCVSATVEGGSHWFNRLTRAGESFDVDLTGDQFGRPAIQVARAGTLYSGTRERRTDELNEETRSRAALLAERAGLRRHRARPPRSR